MSRKKSNKKDTTKLLDKKADFYTDNGSYHIRKNRIYICGSDYYGKVYTITSNKYNRDNVHIIKEIYPYDNKRLRFLILNLKNAKKFGTIEKTDDGKERRIAVIEKFTEASEYICSIGDIKKFESDIVDFQDYKQKKKTESEIKKLILKPEDGKNKKDKKKKVA